MKIEILQEFIKQSDGIQINLNDFFAYACGDYINIEYEDLVWVLPIFEKYGQQGVYACAAYIAERVPIIERMTEKYHAAYREIEKINPKIYSVY